jgi:hypothetical protein
MLPKVFMFFERSAAERLISSCINRSPMFAYDLNYTPFRKEALFLPPHQASFVSNHSAFSISDVLRFALILTRTLRVLETVIKPTPAGFNAAENAFFFLL